MIVIERLNCPAESCYTQGVTRGVLRLAREERRMPINQMTIKLAGEAGQGVESGGAGFGKAMARGGLHIYGLQDYMSRIRGGHNFYQVRVSEQPLHCHEDEVHLLLAFNRTAVDEHLRELVPGAGIIHDTAVKVEAAQLAARGVQDFELPLVKIAEEVGGHRVMMNTAAIAAAAGVTEYDFDRIADVIATNFRRKGPQAVESNLRVARAAYDQARQRYAAGYAWKLRPVVGAPERMVINGNQALAFGALVAGCKFISTYPMTPASTITEWLAAKAAKFGIVQKQTEDEIAAILFAIGASHAGVRAMTATSGGGFCLMVEALGLAGMTETPLVVVDAQRGGPSTGLPTRTEQSDLEFVLHASHGEFPRIVLSVGTPVECFHTAIRAFNLAERYQTPVIILTDMLLSNTARTYEKDLFPVENVVRDRGQYLDYRALEQYTGEYQRHRPTETGISPRAVPGHPNAVYITTGDEHTSFGYITEDAQVRKEQMEKRMRKLEAAARELELPRWIGPADAELTLMTWGSTFGAVREAIDLLNADGIRANLLYFTDIFPLPEDALEAELRKARRLVDVELNYTGQLANVVRKLTGVKAHHKILKYTGRPFSPQEVAARVKAEVMVRV